ncbi:hypothetical protein [Desulfofustis limnaeus]|jgi:phenylacetate-coenzyme A ligase PaaK-like adenylate-forming protein|uniref:Acyl-protein synthetase n=1 Tax=Desulfofustis limnaeus TaxID=2740163 RepID=A0ABM7WAV8_9BACT|nr:hypothetical protein [Desulfofustis limnaeus]MDX9896058.1 hypothetical protein [Desulfofustis sp.]BDD88092.1 acyl-protein synthetase [Desulfofustis limnaeus]
MTIPTTAIDRLFSDITALQTGATADRLFLDAVREAFRHHYEQCPMYQNLCRDAGFSPDHLTGPAAIPAIPWIMVNVFKHHHITSVPEEQITKTFTSSGTSGQFSHIAWDEGSARRQGLMRQRIMEAYGLVSDQPVNYLCFSYDPKISGNKGAAYAHRMYTSFAPAAEMFFAIDDGTRNDQVFQAQECLNRLEAFAASGLPLRVVGFPAFAWKALQLMGDKGMNLQFPGESLIVFGGGWKSLADEAVSPKLFADHVEQRLGITRSRIRDVFGFVEHGVPYISCEAGRFHVPVFSRAYIRRPGTLELLEPGATGLLQVVSPYNMAQPNLSILSTDYARLTQNCPCGRDGTVLQLQGRAGVRKHQGCALTAAELLR